MNEMSREERFFGVSHPVDLTTPLAKKVEPVTEEIEVETGEAPPPPPAPVAAKPAVKKDDIPEDFAADLGDDFDPELKAHLSEKVQKRIKTLTWEREQAKREREEASRLKEEAVNFARTQMQTNQRLQQTIQSGEAYLVQQVKERAELAMAAAKQDYKQAYESGDTDAILVAQDKLIKAQFGQAEAERYGQDYEFRQQQGRQQQQQQRPVPVPQAQVPRPSDRAAKWAEENPWFHSAEHPEMTALALGVHERLVRMEGLHPESDAYFNKLNAEVRKHFPDYFGEEGGESNSQPPRQVVAPGGRGGSGSKRRSVRLEPSEQAIAKALGLTPEQYAAAKIKGAS